MGNLFSILIIITAVLLILIVLVQKSKGGGLSSTFAGSNQVLGVKKTADGLVKITWALAGALIVFSIAASIFISTSNKTVRESMIKDEVQVEMPTFPTNNQPTGEQPE